MTRRVVAIEGKLTRDGRLLNPGSVTMKKDTIPVTMNGNETVVGKATGFERNEETGEISLDILVEIWGDLPDGLNAHVTLYNLVLDTLPHSMVIESGTLIGIFLSVGESAWPELSNTKEEI